MDGMVVDDSKESRDEETRQEYRAAIERQETHDSITSKDRTSSFC